MRIRFVCVSSKNRSFDANFPVVSRKATLKSSINIQGNKKVVTRMSVEVKLFVFAIQLDLIFSFLLVK